MSVHGFMTFLVAPTQGQAAWNPTEAGGQIQTNAASGGAWGAPSVQGLTSAQVMISRFMGSSPASGSVLTARSLEPASDSGSLSLSAPPLLALCLSLCLCVRTKFNSIKTSLKERNQPSAGGGAGRGCSKPRSVQGCSKPTQPAARGPQARAPGRQPQLARDHPRNGRMLPLGLWQR